MRRLCDFAEGYPATLRLPWPAGLYQAMLDWSSVSPVGYSVTSRDTYMGNVCAVIDQAWAYRLLRRCTTRIPQYTLGDALLKELVAILRRGLSAHLRHICSASQDPLYVLLHTIARWTGARMTDLCGGIRAERATWYLNSEGRQQQVPIWQLTISRHKKARFGNLQIWLPRHLIPRHLVPLLEGAAWEPLTWKELSRRGAPQAMGDHESWRRARIQELRHAMTLTSLQTYLSLKAAIWVYLRSMPTAIQDRPQEWFPGGV